ncbi:MAG: glycosyltransferase family 2 protein [Anaerovibrio sp.]|uniref:glycosyltransferase family 2 protein n=1 Tax=Anaerovibrio sp. TaxID=1872532 RepID=UPI0025C57195|nr:glycosyltransferase family 2 protein [Anaerovibrio sp.]MBE6099284.1 glycosyltransferase family 2 protein [Anaerovibrio sp.]
MKIKISACVITKNEAKNMPRWLKCMRTVADEIVVVDTGSTDNTVVLAQSAGAKIAHFKWIDDFAAAKNYAIEQATGDWILFLDADETFTKKAQDVLRQELERFDLDKSVACLLCRLLDIDEDDDNRLFNTSLLPRVFRRSPYIRFAGAIHEQLENSQGNKKMVFADKLEILHTGYSSSIIRAKTQRNLPILISELEKATTQKAKNRLYPYLMDAYNTLGNVDRVLYYAQKCIDINYHMVGAPSHFYEVMTMAMYNAGRPLSEVLAKLDEAEEKYPEEPFFPFVRSLVLEKQEDYLGAEKETLRGLELRKPVEEKMSQGIGMSDTSRGFLNYAYERLGNIYSLKGDGKKAADYYLMALKHHKYQADSLRGLCRILAGIDDVDLIELLNSIYDRELDGKFIVNALKGAGNSGIMAYYGREIKGFEAGYAYMAQGRFDSGAVKLGQRYKELSQLGVLSANNMSAYPQDGYLNVLISTDFLERFGKYKQHSKEDEAIRRLKEYRVRTGLDL